MTAGSMQLRNIRSPSAPSARRTVQHSHRMVPHAQWRLGGAAAAHAPMYKAGTSLAGPHPHHTAPVLLTTDDVDCCYRFPTSASASPRQLGK